MKDEPNKIRQIPVDLIDDPTVAIRTRHNQDGLDSLVRSIRTVGIIQPLVIKRTGKRFEVIAGHRRLLAARMVGLLTVPAITRTIDATKADVLKLHENLCREDVNVVDEAIFIDGIMARYGLGIPKMAAWLNRSETYVRNRIEMKFWDDLLLGAVQNGQLEYSAARWLAKITDEKIRRDYLGYAVQGGLTSHQAYLWFKAWESGTLPPEPSEKVTKDLESGEEKIERVVTCTICGADIPVAEARLFYGHPRCIKQIEPIE